MLYLQGYETWFIWSITQTRLVLTWTNHRTTDYFDTFTIMITKCSAHHGLLVTPIKSIELTDEFTSAALQYHVSTTIYMYKMSKFHFH